MTEPTKRFSNRVEYYLKYRPGYPPAIIELLRAACNLTPASVVADLGCGTGFLARLFLDHGNRVFGVEPNREMRTAGEQLLGHYPNFTSIAATAESTTLPDSSIDFVTAGQAFHWFKPDLATAEFQRILKPAGWVVLVWNERQTDSSPFLAAYEQLLRRYALDYKIATHTNVGDSRLTTLFGRGLKEATFANAQSFDFEGIKGRLLSSSYAPLAGHPQHEPMLAELQAIFRTHQLDGRIEFKYTTHVYYCYCQLNVG
jgi:SAM-dependent methyltransferase